MGQQDRIPLNLKIMKDMNKNTYIEHTSEYGNIYSNMTYQWNEEVVDDVSFDLDNKYQQ